LILASGFGTRLYPLAVTKSKVLLPFRGKPIINHVVDRIPQGIDILVNISKKFEADFRHWQNAINRKVTLCVEPVFSKEQSWGAIHSVDYWIRTTNITDDLMVIAGDNYFEFDLSKFISSYNGNNVSVAVYDIGDKSKATKFGVVRLEGNRIVEFDEKPAVPKSSLIATACWILPPRIFPILSEFCSKGKKDNLGDFIAHLVDMDEVYAYTFTELWLDIGSIDTYSSMQ